MSEEESVEAIACADQLCVSFCVSLSVVLCVLSDHDDSPIARDDTDNLCNTQSKHTKQWLVEKRDGVVLTLQPSSPSRCMPSPPPLWAA